MYIQLLLRIIQELSIPNHFNILIKKIFLHSGIGEMFQELTTCLLIEINIFQSTVGAVGQWQLQAPYPIELTSCAIVLGQIYYFLLSFSLTAIWEDPAREATQLVCTTTLISLAASPKRPVNPTLPSNHKTRHVLIFKDAKTVIP